jgi:predicted Zn-dependent protease
LSTLVLFSAAPQAGADSELPDIGSPANAALSVEDEYQIGRMIVRGLRDQDRIIEDPESTEYIQSLGHQLSAQAQDDRQEFTFFIARDRDINAFALPGGFIGINAGLLLATRNENELAGVLAHEISHVSQRHIARSLAAQSRSSLVSTAAMLAAILVGAAAGGGDAAIAGAAAAQSVAIQQQISFTRENEAEADRVGIALLSRANFNPLGMATFFETLSRSAGVSEAQVPEMLRTHPVTTNRIAEAKGRAAQMEVKSQPDSPSYAVTRERLRVLTAPPGEDIRAYYAAAFTNEADLSPAQVYGRALAMMTTGDAKQAIPSLEKLRTAYPATMQYHTALGQAQLQAGDTRASLATLEKARQLFPRNVAVTVRYAETLMRSGRAKRAHEVLLDLFNTVPPTPEQARLTAMAANSAGDVADAYYYMSEYHVLNGDLPLAVNQLQLALAVPRLNNVQKERFKARLDEIEKALPAKKRAAQPKPSSITQP